MITFIHSTYFKNLLDGFSVGALIMNTQGDIYAVNRVAAELLGRDEESLMGGGLRQSLEPGLEGHGDFARLLDALRAGQDPGEPWRIVYRHAGRGLLHLDVSTALLNEAGKIFGILIEINDVTEIISLHEQEKQILRERHRLQAERIEGLNKLSNAVAHQIRNPAMTIGGMANLMLRRRSPEDPERRYLESVLDGTRRLAAIVEAVGEYTRPLKMSLCPCWTLPLLEEARARIQARAQEMGVSVSLELGGWDLLAMAEAESLVRVLCELAANALEALSSRCGWVALSSRREGDQVVLAVEDDGGGIDPEALPFVFDPFFTTKAVGVGMGLPCARRVVGMMGGDLSLEARQPRGTRATVRVPLADQGGCRSPQAIGADG